MGVDAQLVNKARKNWGIASSEGPPGKDSRESPQPQRPMDRVWFAKLRSERVIRTRSERARMERAQIAPKSATSQIRQGLAHHLVGGAGLDRAFGVPAMAKYLRGHEQLGVLEEAARLLPAWRPSSICALHGKLSAGYAQVLRRGENASGRSHSQPGECDGSSSRLRWNLPELASGHSIGLSLASAMPAIRDGSRSCHVPGARATVPHREIKLAQRLPDCQEGVVRHPGWLQRQEIGEVEQRGLELLPDLPEL